MDEGDVFPDIAATAGDPFEGEEEPGAPFEEMVGVWPHGDPIEFTIPGEPVPWAQMAHNPKTGGRFMPGRQAKHTALYIARWQQFGIATLPKGTAQDPARGVVLSMQFYTERPAYHYGTGRNARVLKDRYREALPTGRPDFSNLLKLAEDALTTAAWADDDQITRIVDSWKTWGRPRSVVRIWLAPPPELPDHEAAAIENAVQAALL